MNETRLLLAFLLRPVLSFHLKHRFTKCEEHRLRCFERTAFLNRSASLKDFVLRLDEARESLRRALGHKKGRGARNSAFSCCIACVHVDAKLYVGFHEQWRRAYNAGNSLIAA